MYVCIYIYIYIYIYIFFFFLGGGGVLLVVSLYRDPKGMLLVLVPTPYIQPQALITASPAHGCHQAAAGQRKSPSAWSSANQGGLQEPPFLTVLNRDYNRGTSQLVDFKN